MERCVLNLIIKLNVYYQEYVSFLIHIKVKRFATIIHCWYSRYSWYWLCV